MNIKIWISVFVAFLCCMPLYATVTEVHHTQGRDGYPLLIIAVEQPVYAALISFSEFDQFVNDIESERKYAVSVVTVQSSSKEELYSYFQSKMTENLDGVLLIGDLPVVTYEHDYDYDSSGSTYAQFPMDLYYMDLDGSWTDSDGDGRLDGHTAGTGDYKPDIWVGRLTSSTVTSGAGQDEVWLIRNYLHKNHLYRTGQLAIDNKAVLLHESDWSSWGTLYLDQVYPDVTVINSGNMNQAYRSVLTENYEFVHVSVHSAATYHAFTGGNIYATALPGIDPTSLFYSLYACTNCRFTTTNYMGGHYIFTPTYGLAAVGSTKVGGMTGYQNFIPKMNTESRQSIGEAFEYWFGYHSSSSSSTVSWSYGMVLLGDPTLGIDIPTSSIDAMPVSATRGEVIAFDGSAHINSGEIVEYQWTSNLDGVLSSECSFEYTSLLSAGEHTISFQVKDNIGRWSTAASESLEIVPADTTVLIHPKETIETTHPEFHWFNDGTYSAYELKVCEIDNDAPIITYTATYIDPMTWTIPDNDSSLFDGKTYRWWIRGLNTEADNEAWQGPEIFRVFLKPIGIYPENSINLDSVDDFTEFQWQSTTAEYEYEIKVENMDNDNTIILSEIGITGSSWSLPDNDSRLQFGTRYQWSIRGKIGTEYTSWSSPVEFVLVFQNDTTPPLTTDDYDNDGAWVNYSVAITLSATDNINGIKQTLYAIDNDAPQDGILIQLDNEGDYDIQYWSIDHAENEENPHTLDIKIDTTAPETEDDYEGGGETGGSDGTGGEDKYKVYFAPIVINLTANDNLSGVSKTCYTKNAYYKSIGQYVQGNPVESTVIELTDIASYNVRYWSLDNAGNEEQDYSNYIYLETVERYDPILIYPRGNITIDDWESLLEFRWTEKLTEYPDYYNRENDTLIASDYLYEIKIEELDCDNNPLLLESNVSGSSLLLTENTLFQEGKTYRWMVRTKYNYDYMESDWSDTWSVCEFVIVDRELSLNHIKQSDNDTVSFTWHQFTDHSYYRVEATDSSDTIVWQEVIPSPPDSFTETTWSITVPQEPTSCFYRVVGMTPYISGVTPQTVQKDSVVSITITGNHTNWTSGTVLLRCDYGITVDSLSVLSDTELTAQITVSDSTVTGYRSIEVICDTLAVVKENAIEITE